MDDFKFEGWLNDQLFTNLTENNVMVVDNAIYHNKQINGSKTTDDWYYKQ